jgi:putative SOS response-associated peptidase YedK
MATPGEVIADAFALSEVPSLGPRYNITPTQPVAVVRGATGARRLDLLRWGLVPAWASDLRIGSRLINARAESVAEKPSFRDALRARRCLVIADGFYEWRREGSGKRPYLIRFVDGRPFAFAGLWERWGRGGTELESCAIVTCPPNPIVSELHDRMPVILAPRDHDLWLDGDVNDPARLLPLLAPCSPAGMESFPVSTRVNDPAVDVPECRDRLELEWG